MMLIKAVKKLINKNTVVCVAYIMQFIFDWIVQENLFNHWVTTLSVSLWNDKSDLFVYPDW